MTTGQIAEKSAGLSAPFTAIDHRKTGVSVFDRLVDQTACRCASMSALIAAGQILNYGITVTVHFLPFRPRRCV
jgi:hypothetical protein